MSTFANLGRLVLGLVIAPILSGSALEPESPTRSARVAWEAVEDLPRAGFENFRAPAGRMVDGVLRVTLEARAAEWRPWGEEGPVLLAHVFAADGEVPRVPAPLIRVHAGTPVHVTMRNRLPDTLLVRGLRDPGEGDPGLAAVVADQIVVVPDGETEFRFTPTVPGTYSWGGDGLGPGAQADRGLRGLFIVDPPGEEPDPEERFFLITHWGDPDRPASFLPSTRFFLNGRSWPHTERLTYTQGDTVRWRVVNFSGRPHPMHLHGFHFQVDARGDLFREQVFAPEERRLVVTEALEPAESIRMSWVATEPGNWIFHCHFMRHMSWLQTAPLEGPPLTHIHAHEGPDGAPEGEDLMGGLVLGITVAPLEDYHPDASLPRRRLDLFVNERDGVFGTEPGYAFVLGEGSSQPAADSVHFPGSVLLLRRGEPTEIVVHNRSRVPLGVHWHGLELESWADGVPGWSGLPGNTVPAIGPGDSLAVRMAPPRAGTFMYHVHSEPGHQLAQGLYAPLLVLDEGEGWDPERDRLFLLGSLGPGDDPPPAVNGRLEPWEEVFREGESYRLRFMHISPDDDKQVALLRDGAPVTWLPVAKDGADLPESQVTGIPARLQIFVGETYDFLWTPTEPGDYTLRVVTTFDAGAPIFPRDAPAPDTMDIPVTVLPRFEPGPCPFEAEPAVLEQFRCGTLTVLEDRSRPDGRTLKLAVAILSSTSDDPQPDPVVLVPGGPGDAILHRFAGAVASAIRADREIVAFDPRGTGFSEPAVCSELDQEWQRIRWVVDLEPEERRREEIAALERCRAEIDREEIDLSQYDTRSDALDLDDLRRALGYDRWNVWGRSYGSLVALEGLRSTPEGIRSVVLDGPTPPDVGRSIEERNRKFADALSRLFAHCADDATCNAAIPDAEAQFWNAIEGLDREPMVIPTGGRGGLPDPVVLRGANLATGARQALYSRSARLSMPLLAQEVLARNEAFVLEVVVQMVTSSWTPRAWKYLSVDCHDRHPFTGLPSPVPPHERGEAVLAGAGRAEYDPATCEAWHPFRADAAFAAPVVSATPALILTGEFDPAAHRAYGLHVAASLERAQLVEVPGGAHVEGNQSPCARAMIAGFLRDPGRSVDTECLDALPPVRFLTRVEELSGGGAPARPQPEAAGSSLHAPRFEPGPCPFDAEAEVLAGIDCGTVRVPENWAASNGRTIGIPVAVLRATGPAPRTDAVITLGGGPTPSLSTAAASADRPLRRDRDVVLFDFRGTGYADAVCPDLGAAYMRVMSRPLTAPESVVERGQVAAACRAWAEAHGVELEAYNARNMARDVIAIAQALGYREWNIVSVSFGTLVAQEIMRREPPGLRAAALLGPVPPHTETLAANGFVQALEQMARYCVLDEACAAAFPDPIAEYTGLYDALEREPLRLPPLPADRTRDGDFYLTGSVLQLLAHQKLYVRTSLSVLPLTVRAAANGNLEPMAVSIAEVALRAERLSGATWAAQCDGMRAWAMLDPSPEPHVALEDAFRIEMLSRCVQLGVEAAPGESRVPVESETPALVLVGEHDPVTPPAFARAIMDGMRNGTLIEIPGRGHEFPGACVSPLLLAFFNDPAGVLDSTCFQSLPEVPFELPTSTGVPR